MTNAFAHNWWIFISGNKIQEIKGTTTLQIPITAFYLRKTEIQINIRMELNINGNTYDSVPVVAQRRNFSRNINRKNVANQIGVMQIFNRFGSIKTHFRVDFVLTNNMSIYANTINNDRRFIKKSNLVGSLI